jgi:hypothetical protein
LVNPGGGGGEGVTRWKDRLGLRLNGKG